MSGKIFVVATPIGNLDDISLRATQTLKGVDLVVAEDTRVSKKLLSRLGISKPVKRVDDNVSEGRIESVLKDVLEGRSIAFLTDSGTPNVSDPGYKILKKAIELGIRDIHPVPGPSAVAAVVSISHFPMNTFAFLGFPPAKKGRNKFFDNLSLKESQIIFYESPHRILKTIKEVSSRDSKREAVVAKELTKIHENVWRGSIGHIYAELENLDKSQIRGEWVVALSKKNK